jgi:apolipoprotein N-acyltransferase
MKQASLAGLFSALLLAASFPPVGAWWLAWIALIPLFVFLYKTNKYSEALFSAFIFMLVFMGINLWGIINLIRFVGWWAVLGWLALTIFQALFAVLFAALTISIDKRVRLYFIPFGWVLINEWLRSLGLFGFTIGDIAYSQASFLPFIQIASLTGVYGVSFLMAAFNAALVDLKHKFYLPTILLLIGLSCLWGSYQLHSNSKPRPTITLSLIQPNIDQADRMNTRMLPAIFQIHEAMTRQAMASHPNIILWPETALFTFLTDDPILFPRVKQLAREARAWMVVGTPYSERSKIYNSIIVISPAGQVVSRYNKQWPVPFGEYLPFRPLLFPLLRTVGYYDQEFSPDPYPTNLKIGGWSAAAGICFESCFPDLMRQRVRAGADFMIVITNDAWFDRSAISALHLDFGVFRAIENRKYFIQEGNTGLSAVIDPYGRIVARTQANQRRILTVKIAPR